MANSLHVEIVAPDQNVFRGEATRFRAPGVNGTFEVLVNHAPLLAAVGVGPVYITTLEGERIAFATSGGFVEVLNNRITMLAETAEPASEIDVARAQEAEEKARARLEAASGEDRAAAETELERARNRARVAMGAVGSKRN